MYASAASAAAAAPPPRRTALVTGASSGIGHATALALRDAGYSVVVVSRSLARLEAAFPAASRERLYFVAADLATPGGCAHCVASARAALLPLTQLNALVNNAGSGQLSRPISDAASAMPAYDYTLALDLRAPYELTALCADWLASDGSGSIVNVSSIAAARPLAGLSAYCIAKAGVEMLTKCAALELAPRRIRVNCIAPATIETSFHEAAGMAADAARAYYAASCATHPIGRVGVPSDIAALALFLADERQAGFMTGSVIPVDGGRLLTAATAALAATPAAKP